MAPKIVHFEMKQELLNLSETVHRICFIFYASTITYTEELRVHAVKADCYKYPEWTSEVKEKQESEGQINGQATSMNLQTYI